MKKIKVLLLSALLPLMTVIGYAGTIYGACPGVAYTSTLRDMDLSVTKIYTVCLPEAKVPSFRLADRAVGGLYHVFHSTPRGYGARSGFINPPYYGIHGRSGAGVQTYKKGYRDGYREGYRDGRKKQYKPKTRGGRAPFPQRRGRTIYGYGFGFRTVP